MENIKAIIREANSKLNTADHLAYVTYPLVKDVRLLLTTTENVFTAMILAMEALLQYERYYKRISFVPNDFMQKYEMFKQSSRKYNLDRMTIALILDLKSLIELHKKSPMVFTREQKLVIASHGFSVMKTLNIDNVKNYVQQAKPFIAKINKVIVPNDRRFT